MLKAKQVFQIAKQNFSGWNRSPRIWMTFFLAFVLCLMMSDEIISQAVRYEMILQIVEPFIWTYGDATSVMLSSLLLTLLFADMPFINQETPYWLIRTSRNVWLAGQVLYVVVATVLYNVFLLVVLGIMAMPFAYWGNVWSETAAMLGYGGGESITIPVSIKTMESSSPYECMISVFALMLLYSLVITCFMLCLNLMAGNMAGVLGAFGVNLYGILLNPSFIQKIFHFTGNLSYKANILCGWLSPLNHATFPMHNFGYDCLPKLWNSMLIFGIVILGLIFISREKIRHYNFTFIQMDE